MKSTLATPAEFLAAREPTGPASVSLWRLLRGYRSSDPLVRWSQIRAEHGAVARYQFGLADTYFISGAEGVGRVLLENAANYTKDHGTYQMLRRVFGNGLLTSDGSFWVRQRRLAAPAFHRHRIAAMGQQMVAAAAEVAERWEELGRQGQGVSMLKEMSRLTLRVVGDALFGTGLADKAGAVAGAWDTLNLQLVERFSTKRLFPPVLPTRYDREFRQARHTLFGVVEQIIAARRSQGGGDDLLSMFMQTRDEDTGEQMTDGQLRDEVVTMLLAGHETTSTALAWLWALLAQHPAVATKLHAELDEVLGGRLPTAADYPRLAFTRAVVEETMRLHSPAYIINRRVASDDVVQGCRVRRGGAIVISPLFLHRQPEYWERPDDFFPERWADAEAEAKRPRFAFIPFSGGPRQCIGNTFAMMEAVLLVATLAQRFEPRLAEGYVPQVQYLVFARPSEGAPMTLSKRSGQQATARSGGAGAGPDAKGVRG
jgi:cytochrome P450